MILRELEGGLEEIHEQTRGAVQSRDRLRSGDAVETALAEELAHDSSVFFSIQQWVIGWQSNVIKLATLVRAHHMSAPCLHEISRRP
jgi:hypothetical protein